MRVACLVCSCAGVVLAASLDPELRCEAQGIGTIELFASDDFDFLPVYAADPDTHQPVAEIHAGPLGKYLAELHLMMEVENGIDKNFGMLRIEGDERESLRIEAKIMDLADLDTTGQFFFSAIVGIEADSDFAEANWNFARSLTSAFGSGTQSSYPASFNVFSNSYLLTPNDFFFPDLSGNVTITDPNQSTVSSIVSEVPETPGAISGILTQLDVNILPFTTDEEFFAWSEMQYRPLLNPWSDYNGDGVVDAADFAMFRNWFVPGEETESPLQNDPTPESVKQDDYDQWRTHYGESVPIPPAPPAYAAPAPAAMRLALLAFAVLLWRIGPTRPRAARIR